MAVAYFLHVLWDRLLVLPRLLRWICGWILVLGVLRLGKGQNGPGPGSGFLTPFFLPLHDNPIGILGFLCSRFARLVTLATIFFCLCPVPSHIPQRITQIWREEEDQWRREPLQLY